MIHDRMSGSLTYRVSVAVDRSRFPSLFSFVEWGIDMQVADVRDLLRLPMPEAGLESGQNFAATAALVNLIAGASIWFFEASEEGLANRGDRGRRYCKTLDAYWPWDGEVVDAAVGIQVPCPSSDPALALASPRLRRVRGPVRGPNLGTRGLLSWTHRPQPGLVARSAAAFTRKRQRPASCRLPRARSRG
jgi:hypothetical protein